MARMGMTPESMDIASAAALTSSSMRALKSGSRQPRGALRRPAPGRLEAMPASLRRLYEVAGMGQSESADLCGRERSTIGTGITKYHKDHSRHDIDGWLELVRTCVEEVTS